MWLSAESLIPIVGIENDGKIRLVIILEQLMCPGSTDNTVSIRVKLYKVHTECREGVIVEDMTEQGICSRRISVTIGHRVVPGKYIIVPHTDREDLEKEFMIVVYTPTPLPGVRYNIVKQAPLCFVSSFLMLKSIN